MHKSLDAGFDFDEGAEVGGADDLAGDQAVPGVLGGGVGPRVALGLFEREGDFVVAGVEGDDLDADDVAGLADFLGPADAFPAHFAQGQQSLDAGGDFDEGAEVGGADDAAGDAVAGLDVLAGGDPRVGLDLFHAQGDAALVGVDFEDLHADLVAGLDDVGRFFDVLIAEVGDVDESVDAAEVDEGAEFDDAGDDAVDDLLGLDVVEGLFLGLFALVLEVLAA